ncbi:MAG: XRE family transcriptional regulator [Bacteroidetes bacterium]|nr:MAG: XRE family transcriptional regulator [Bacteroidota bacterium]
MTKKRQAGELIKLVAKNIKYYRKRSKMTQEQLQEETGLYFPRYESGKNDMTLTTLGILSEHLNIEPYMLLIKIK